jgi:hypothetical protein
MFDASDTGTVQSAVNSAQYAFSDLPSALAYINSQWNNFLQLPGKILAAQHEANLIQNQAAAAGSAPVAQSMATEYTYLGQLYVTAEGVADEMNTLQGALSELGLDLNGNASSGGAVPDSAFGLGQVPINGWTIATALSVAVLLAGTIGYLTYRSSASFQRVALGKQAMALIAAGKLTADSAANLINKAAPPAGPGVFGNIQTTVGYLALGALAVFVLPGVLKKGRR